MTWAWVQTCGKVPVLIDPFMASDSGLLRASAHLLRKMAGTSSGPGEEASFNDCRVFQTFSTVNSMDVKDSVHRPSDGNEGRSGDSTVNTLSKWVAKFSAVSAWSVIISPVSLSFNTRWVTFEFRLRLMYAKNFLFDVSNRSCSYFSVLQILNV